ncbi:MAG: Gfo/Idh/MocA family oxidoreductase [Bacteroidetes bacterium]|nr:Gfo/Idh/MocA family oxidoreductase [Bacteroidota bacterium]
MAKKHFGFGIVGAGMIAQVHARAIAEIANAKLIGIYSIHKNKSDDFAQKHGCTVFNTLEEMLKVPEMDIICICTPSGIHLEPALKCIEAGKHCLIEKPMEITLERCDGILEAARKAAVKIGVIFPSRFYDKSRLLKKSVDANRFGQLVLGSAYIKWSRSPEYYASGLWRGTWQYDGGGALMNQGIHSVDLLQWFMGPVVSVQSVAANIRHKGIEVEDTIVSTLKFQNGALGTIECSTAVFPGALKRIEIMGTEGTAVLEEDHFLKWQFQRENREDASIRNEMGDGAHAQGGASNPADIGFLGHQRQIEDMMHAVETGTEPLVNGEEGRKSVEIVMAIYETARSGKMVTLPIRPNLPIT